MSVASVFAASMLALILTNAEREEDRCAALGELAQGIMQARQGGRPMSEILRATEEDRFAPLRPVIRSMVIEAYDRPQHWTDDMKREAAQRFRNDIELMCYQLEDQE
ncbi:MAG: hypothetical protein ACXIVO_12895 [Glycocaulis sp.]